MEKEKIERINFLAKKSREDKLTKEELEEQKALREEYLEGVRRSLRSQLDSIEYVDEEK